MSGKAGPEVSDSDDDLCISDLIKKRKILVKAEVKEKQPDAKKEQPKRQKSEPEKKQKSESSSYSTSSNRSNCELFYDTSKGKLVQQLLCRWWYAIEWPKQEDITEPPPGYEALEGFKGVYICTSTDSLGSILDTRNKETCPSLRNLSKFKSDKLKQLCVTAYEKQMELLADLEGDESALLRELKGELREIKNMNADLADTKSRNFKF